MVRTERLELSHLAAPEPKSGASTNSATSAFFIVNYLTNLLLIESHNQQLVSIITIFFTSRTYKVNEEYGADGET